MSFEIQTHHGKFVMSDKTAWLGFYNQYVSCEYRSLAKLSKYIGISMKLLNKIFKFHNFVKMPKGNRKQIVSCTMGNLDKSNISDWEFIISKYTEGMSIETLGETYGVPPTTLARILKSFDIKIRDTAERNILGVRHAKISNLRKYGVESLSGTKEVQMKARATLFKNKGVYHITELDSWREDRRRLKISEQIRITNKKLIEQELNLLSEYVGVFDKDTQGNYIRWHVYEFNCLKCSNVFKDSFDNFPKCPKCRPSPKSKPELEIRDYIEKMGILVECSRRDLISNPITRRGLEIDIYLPELKLAFEYNGYIYHLEESKSTIDEKKRWRNFIKKDGYHDNKTAICQKVGIRLVHLWESRKQDNMDELKRIVDKEIRS